MEYYIFLIFCWHMIISLKKNDIFKNNLDLFDGFFVINNITFWSFTYETMTDFNPMILFGFRRICYKNLLSLNNRLILFKIMFDI